MPVMKFLQRFRSHNISDEDPEYRVTYLGNIQSSMMKGDGCVDRPVSIIWKNYKQNPARGVDMRLTVCRSGLRVSTKEHEAVQYHAHRIAYYTADHTHPRLFVWVYKHEGKKMKAELRCHVALCKTAETPLTIASVLKIRIQTALREFVKEKTRRQNLRLTLQKVKSFHGGNPVRRQKLSEAKNFKPPSDTGQGAPKLRTIGEGIEEEEEDEHAILEEEEEEQFLEGGSASATLGRRKGSLTQEAYGRVLGAMATSKSQPFGRSVSYEGSGEKEWSSSIPNGYATISKASANGGLLNGHATNGHISPRLREELSSARAANGATNGGTNGESHVVYDLQQDGESTDDVFSDDDFTEPNGLLEGGASKRHFSRRHTSPEITNGHLDKLDLPNGYLAHPSESMERVAQSFSPTLNSDDESSCL